MMRKGGRTFGAACVEHIHHRLGNVADSVCRALKTYLNKRQLFPIRHSHPPSCEMQPCGWKATRP